MDVYYVEAKVVGNVLKLDPDAIKSLPKDLFLAYSIQYEPIARRLKKLLENNGITISGFKQVLGCSNVKTSSPILFVGAGRFHATNLYLQASSVYLFEDNHITKVPDDEIQRLKKKHQASISRFLAADDIGILVSLKPGQENLALANKIKEKLLKKGKNAYVFLSSNIDLGQFENYSIKSWINTACLGLANDDSRIVNYADIIQYL